jgi:hypothetical protein
MTRLALKASTALLALAFAACGTTDSSGTTGTVVVRGLDGPPIASHGAKVPRGVDHIYLTVREVSIHDTATGRWDTLARPASRIDFLQLVNGMTATLGSGKIPAGSYSQLRLVLADTNEVVVSGQSELLKVPSGTSSGLKINLDFDVKADEIIELYVDFDAARSITWTRNNNILRPVFRAFKKVLSGTIAGTVRDGSSNPVPNASVHAVAGADTTSTITATDGTYKFIILAGTYGLSASADGYTLVDTTYSGVNLAAEQALTGYNFRLTP